MLSLNETAFYFSMSLPGFSTQNLHFVREILVYSTNILIFFNDKSFLMDIFNQKTSSGFCLLVFFFFSFTKTDFHLYWRLLQRGWDFSLHVFHMSDLKQQGKNKGKLGNAFYCNVCSLSHCRSLIIYLTNLCHKWYSWFCLWTKEGIKASQNCFQPYFSIL